MRVEPRNNNNNNDNIGGNGCVAPRGARRPNNDDDDDDDDDERRRASSPRRDLRQGSRSTCCVSTMSRLRSMIGKCLPVGLGLNEQTTFQRGRGGRRTWTWRAKNLGGKIGGRLFGKRGTHSVAGDCEGERGDRKRGWNRANSRELPCYDHVRLSRVAVVYTEPTRSLSCECRERVLSVCFSALCLRLREPALSFSLSPSLSFSLVRVPSRFLPLSLSLSLSRSLSRSLSFDHTLVTPLLYFPSNASIVLARTFTIGRLSIFIRRVACASDCASLLALVLALSRERECLTCEVSKTGVPSYVLRHCATRPTRSPTLCHYAGFRGSLSRGEGRARASELASVQRRGRARGKR